MNNMMGMSWSFVCVMGGVWLLAGVQVGTAMRAPINPTGLPDFTRGVRLEALVRGSGLESMREEGVGEGRGGVGGVGGRQGGEAEDGIVDPMDRVIGLASLRRLRGDETGNGDAQQCAIEENVAYVGGTLAGGDGTSMRIKGVQSPADCCGQCACIDGCVAWSWSKATKICYPKAAGYTRDPMRAGVYSGVIADPKIKYFAKGTKIWQPKLTVGEHSLSSFGKETSRNDRADNKYVVKDPTCSSNDPVVRAMYHEGRWSPGQGDGGGVLFFAWPAGKDVSLGNTVRLEYEVYFPENFDWVKGGKLPGIIGGRTGCGGGDDADDCFSVRVMWRREGEGEAYIYTDKDTWTSDLCDTPGTRCDSNAGMSYMRGAFRFERERWIKIAITVSMNDVGRDNGYVRLDVDGEAKIESDKLTYRASNKVFPEAFTFSTWFGGSDETWSPSTTLEAYFRNFKMYRLD